MERFLETKKGSFNDGTKVDLDNTEIESDNSTYIPNSYLEDMKDKNHFLGGLKTE